MLSSPREIAGEIVRLCSNLRRSKTNRIQFRSNMWKLERLLLNDRLSQSAQDEIIALKEIKRDLPALRSYYEKFETDLEYDFTREFLKKESPSIRGYALYKRFVVLVRNEARLANISGRDCVLFIGSGPLPITAILLHELTGCRVDCYDSNKRAAEISIDVLKQLGRSRAIRVHNRSGESLGSNSYSAIVIALLAKPKDGILRAVWKNSRKGARIICRTSDGIRQVFYEQTDPHLFDQYGQAGKVYAKGDQTISSVLLVGE